LSIETITVLLVYPSDFRRARAVVIV